MAGWYGNANTTVPAKRRRSPSVSNFGGVAKKLFDEVIKEAKRQVTRQSQSKKYVSNGTFVANERKKKSTGAYTMVSGRSGGKYTRRTSRKLTKKRSNAISGGIQYTKEQKGQVFGVDGDSSSAAYIGHFTHDHRLLFTQVIRGMVKAAYLKKGYTITDFTEDAFAVFGADTWSITGYQSPASNTVASLGATTLAAATTWDAACQSLFLSWSSSKGQRDYYKAFVITGGDTSESISIPMVGMKIQGYVKSTLKVQNRTVGDEEAGSELTTALAANPVNGYLYRGRGCGTSLKGDRVVSFPGTGNTGVIEASSTLSGISAVSEPPKPAQIARCDRSHKCLLEPSQLKTSVVYAPVNTTFQKLYQALNDYSPSTNFQGFGPGRFAMFALEKMMDEEESPVVTINYEANWFCNLKVVYHASRYTIPINDV